MQTHISSFPHVEAGEFIGSILRERSGRPVLFLVSGGSALQVLDTIAVDALGEHVHIGLTDNRYTDDTSRDNFYALTQTAFYRNAQHLGAHILSFAHNVGESHEEYAQRLSSILDIFYSDHKDAFTLGLFDIGDDGHTASIFSAPQNEFDKQYRTDTYYVPVHKESLTDPLRVSVSIPFIEEKCDQVILYAVGSNKCDNILTYMHTKQLQVHELPALIPARHPQSDLFTDCEALI